jgi:electron transport complex protein RnfC
MAEIRGTFTFPGGVHPPESKHISENCAIEAVPSPKQLPILLSQHLGAPCQPLVAKRDKVQVGQMIGKSESFVSAPVHSPVNGTVKDIALQSHPVVGRTLAVLIDTDADNTPVLPVFEHFTSTFSTEAFTTEQICGAITLCRMVGMSGGSFSDRFKIEPNRQCQENIII